MVIKRTFTYRDPPGFARNMPNYISQVFENNYKRNAMTTTRTRQYTFDYTYYNNIKYDTHGRAACENTWARRRRRMRRRRRRRRGGGEEEEEEEEEEEDCA